MEDLPPLLEGVLDLTLDQILSVPKAEHNMNSIARVDASTPLLSQPGRGATAGLLCFGEQDTAARRRGSGRLLFGRSAVAMTTDYRRRPPADCDIQHPDSNPGRSA
jgi:hypothetical protein